MMMEEESQVLSVTEPQRSVLGPPTNAALHQPQSHHQATLNSQKLVWGSDVYGGENWEDSEAGGP